MHSLVDPMHVPPGFSLDLQFVGCTLTPEPGRTRLATPPGAGLFLLGSPGGTGSILVV